MSERYDQFLMDEMVEAQQTADDHLRTAVEEAAEAFRRLMAALSDIQSSVTAMFDQVVRTEP